LAPFLSTLPARGATGVRMAYDKHMDQFLSTLPARGATNNILCVGIAPQISIHAPREGSDWCSLCNCPGLRNFYPRSPRGERLAQFWCVEVAVEFLSTLPARGATGPGIRHPAGR